MSYEPYNPATEQYKRFALAHETMLPPEAESDLFARIDGEDPTDSAMATEELATAYLALVAQIAGEYKDRGVFFDDLLSEGNLGLMKAVKKYDRTRKPGATSFSPSTSRFPFTEPCAFCEHRVCSPCEYPLFCFSRLMGLRVLKVAVKICSGSLSFLCFFRMGFNERNRSAQNGVSALRVHPRERR